MLRELTVKNLAVVESCTVRFAPGLNVISGETGAGKSVILGALGLVLGGRGRADMVRNGESAAQVCAVFERDGQRVEVCRTVPVRGSGRSTIDGASATLADLQALGNRMLSITGQHDQRLLLDPDQHQGLVDRYGGVDLSPMEAAWAELCEARQALRSLEAARDGAAERAMLLRFQLRELAELDPRVGEAEELRLTRDRLRHAVELQAAAQGAEEALYSEEGSAVDRLARACGLLERVEDIEPEHRPRVERLRALLVEVEELGRELQGALRRAPDPAQLDEIEERLQAFERLCRKHACSPDALAEQQERLHHELEDLSDVDGGIERAQARVAAALARATVCAEAVHHARSKAARRLDQAIEGELESLAMPQARLATALSKGPLGPAGHDVVELRLSANVGEPPRALHRVASGGELSRVLLALKLHLHEPGASLVFDEIDSGIGGCTAESVGRRLAALSTERQLVCISHLPQIASLAQAHFAVLKSVSGGRTFSTIRALDEAGRVEEVARMIGGSALGGDTKLYARKLIQAYAHVA